MSLLSALAAAMPLPHDQARADDAVTPYSATRHGPPADAILATPARPVLQLVPLPLTVDTLQYRGALSNENPGGDVRRLRAFRDLVDPLPAFSTYYHPQGSTEAVYATVVHGAVADPDALFAQQVISDCRQRLSEHAFASMDGAVGSWCPVYASPSDWAEDLDPSRFSELVLDLSGEEEVQGPYSFIGTPTDLRLHSRHGPVPLDPRTNLGNVRMRYLLVTLGRPWMNSTLFTTRGWGLPLQRPGFCSNGKLEGNDGVIPIVPTGLLLAKDFSIEAQWAPSDRALIEAAAGQEVSLGPIPLLPSASTTTLHVIAWTSALTPLSPVGSEETHGVVQI